MQPQQATKDNYIAIEIFNQLKASRVNRFPFFAYTGIKPSIFSSTALYLKLPKNQSKFKSILVTLNLTTDTYDVNFYTHDDPLKAEDRHSDIYNDSLVDLIVKEMGVL